jgi:hypothetical protein
MSKYNIKINDLERTGGIAKLERDGFNKEHIMKTMYKLTEGATQREREQMVSKLYDRQKPC